MSEFEVENTNWLDEAVGQAISSNDNSTAPAPLSSDTAYRQDEALSQSFLKATYHTPEAKRAVANDDYLSKRPFEIGGAVDCLLTRPTEFNQLYYTNITPKPSNTIVQVINYLVAHKLDWCEENLILAREVFKVYPTYNLNTYIAAMEKCKDHYDEKFANRDRISLTPDDTTVVHAIVNSFKTNARTKHLFDEAISMQRLYQLEVYFMHDGVQLKSMLDLVLIDHQTKEVFPYDIKTTGKPVRYFPQAVKMFGYHIQAAQYSLGLEYGALNQAIFKIGGQVIDLDITGYRIQPFKFIVQTTNQDALLKYNSQPHIFTLDEDLVLEGRFGKLVQQKPHNVELSPTTTLNDVLVCVAPGLAQLIEAHKFQTNLEATAPEEAWQLTQKEHHYYNAKGAVVVH